jgi:hypothetical protein
MQHWLNNESSLQTIGEYGSDEEDEDAAVQDADVSDEVKRQLAEIDALARSQHRVPL